MTQALTKTLLITGASGFLGWYLCQEAMRQGWVVHGTYCTHLFPQPGLTMHPVDLTDFAQVKRAIAQIKPDAVIHAAAQARPNQCEIDPATAHAINVTASLNLAGLCSDGVISNGVHRSIPCVFVSTNQVFDGTKAPYREIDPVSPINVYGEQKVMAEEGMRSRHPQILVCRMPLMFGQAPTAPSFLQGFLERIQKGDALNLFTDEFRTPLSGWDAAKGLLLALDALIQNKPETESVLSLGCLHLGGAERLSRYEFGQILVTVLGIDKSYITACRQADLKMAAARAPDLTMDGSRAAQLGYAPMAVKVALERLQL